MWQYAISGWNAKTRIAGTPIRCRVRTTSVGRAACGYAMSVGRRATGVVTACAPTACANAAHAVRWYANNASCRTRNACPAIVDAHEATVSEKGAYHAFIRRHATGWTNRRSIHPMRRSSPAGMTLIRACGWIYAGWFRITGSRCSRTRLATCICCRMAPSCWHPDDGREFDRKGPFSGD